MLSNVEHWLVSAAVIIVLLVVLFACICGCRKKVPKNELLGLAGMVKITNPEETLDANSHRENGSSAIIDNNHTSVDTAETHRRAATSTANRSLPDLPVDLERMRTPEGADTVWEASEPHSDACSALYATVTENKEATQLLAVAGELALGASDDGKGSEYSSLSQTEDAFAPYALLKGEHPYDRLRKSEHPYAQVGGATQSRRPRSSAPATVNASNPIAPPRQRKANSFHATTPSGDAEVGDIAAATAIAGHVSANQELPYMTPPIVVPTAAAATEGQVHFSGDSQDSSKGYTSISVREPLANIKAQSRQRRNVGDDVYTTVSDDSEEVYADIEDTQGVYTSGSETYAQILPPPEPTPPPPSVDSLKHVAQAHSRQASSSSAASSVANLGSPKPEKRQANSPLPPPPPAGHAPDVYATVDKKPSNVGVATTERSLDEMYAKVMKRTQRGKDLDASSASSRRLSTDSRSHSTESEPCIEESATEPPPSDGQSLSSADSEGRDLRHPYRPLPETEPIQSVAVGYTDPGYEVVQQSPDAKYKGSQRSRGDPNYEAVHGAAEGNYEEVQRLTTDPNYAEVHRARGDPNYEEVRRSTDPNYEAVHEPPDGNYEEVQRLVTDPNYAELQRSRGDPNYAEVHPQGAMASDIDSSSEPGYASIGYPDTGYEKVMGESLTKNNFKKTRAKSLVEPDYEKVYAKNLAEKVRSKSVVEPSYAKIDKKRRPKSSVVEEPGYARVHHPDDDGNSTLESETDPNYETVARLDPAYETVARLDPAYETVARLDPAYETVANLDPTYDSVNFASLPSEPPYELLTNSRDSSNNVSPSTQRLETDDRKSLTDYDDVRVK